MATPQFFFFVFAFVFVFSLCRKQRQRVCGGVDEFHDKGKSSGDDIER
jgi:hypothetical protein